MRTLTVHFACNDPDHGTLTNRVEAIELFTSPTDDCLLRLYGNSAYYQNGRARVVRIAGISLPLSSDIAYSVGNWCWNAAEMDVVIVAGLLNLLRRRGWSPEEGDDRLWERWESKQEFTAADLLAALEPA